MHFSTNNNCLFRFYEPRYDRRENNKKEIKRQIKHGANFTGRNTNDIFKILRTNLISYENSILFKKYEKNWKKIESPYIKKYTLRNGSEKIYSFKTKLKLKLLLSRNGVVKVTVHKE